MNLTLITTILIKTSTRVKGKLKEFYFAGAKAQSEHFTVQNTDRLKCAQTIVPGSSNRLGLVLTVVTSISMTTSMASLFSVSGFLEIVKFAAIL